MSIPSVVVVSVTLLAGLVDQAVPTHRVAGIRHRDPGGEIGGQDRGIRSDSGIPVRRHDSGLHPVLPVGVAPHGWLRGLEAEASRR